MTDKRIRQLAEQAARYECGHNARDRKANFGAMNPATRGARVRAIERAIRKALLEELESLEAWIASRV